VLDEALAAAVTTASAPVTTASIFDASVLLVDTSGAPSTEVASGGATNGPSVEQMLQEMQEMRLSMQRMAREQRELLAQRTPEVIPSVSWPNLSGAPRMSTGCPNPTISDFLPATSVPHPFAFPPATTSSAPTQSGPGGHLPVPISTNDRLGPPRHVTAPIPADKVAQIMCKWPVRFKGNDKDPLTVKDFLYRVSALTTSTLRGDFQLLCNNVSVLLEDRASTWFWRFHASMGGQFTWAAFCTQLSEEFRDRRSDFRIRELIRGRKQKEKEKFDTYYNDVLLLVDRLTHPLSGPELIDILRNNLRPELQRGILYVPTPSVGQLREVILQHEILEEELSKSGNRGDALVRRVAELDSAVDELPMAVTEPVEVSSLNAALSRCWNCAETGHRWDSCQSKEWRKFCWGCGTPGVIKPKCARCSSKNSSRQETSSSPSPAREGPKPM